MYQCQHFIGYQALCGRLSSKRLCTAVMAAMVGWVGTPCAVAAESIPVPAKPIGAAGLSASNGIAPLSGTMHINSAKFKLPIAVNPALVNSGVQAACSAVDPSRYTQLLHAIEAKEGSCSAASFSVAEQRSAGCSGSDTVDLCQVKLFTYCMDQGGDRAKFKAAADQELALASTAKDKLDVLMQYIRNSRALHSGEGGGNSLPLPPPMPKLGPIVIPGR